MKDYREMIKRAATIGRIHYVLAEGLLPGDVILGGYRPGSENRIMGQRVVLSVAQRLIGRKIVLETVRDNPGPGSVIPKPRKVGMRLGVNDELEVLRG